jgi:Flp pilus assembly protein TadG
VAATIVESAMVYPVTFLLALGLIIGGLGIFRYQEISNLTGEAARYASVHGINYARDAGTQPPIPDDIYNTVVVPKAVALDLSQLSYQITYNTSNSPNHSVVVNNDVTTVTNTVKVTLTYQWIPEAFLGGIALSSTSEMPMSY